MILNCCLSFEDKTVVAAITGSTPSLGFTYSQCAYLYTFKLSKESCIVPNAKDWTDHLGERLLIIAGMARKTSYNL